MLAINKYRPKWTASPEACTRAVIILFIIIYLVFTSCCTMIRIKRVLFFLII